MYNKVVRTPVFLSVLGLAFAGCTVDSTCLAGEVCIVVGTGEAGFNGDGLPPLETDLYLPTAVLPGPDGEMLFVDFNNLRIRALTKDGTVETRVGNGIHAYSVPGNEPTRSPLENPIDAAVGPDGLLYVLPLHEGRVLRVSAEERMEVVAGTGELGDGGDGGPAVDAQLNYPAGIAFGAGAMYVSDQVRGTVRRIDSEGVIETVVSDLSLPRGLWADDERLLVADAGNGRVVQFDFRTAAVTTLVGDSLAWPDAVEVTPGGTVLISEQRGARISAWDGELRTVLGDSDLVGPGGLRIVDGDLWIADTEGSRILVWDGAVDAID